MNTSRATWDGIADTAMTGVAPPGRTSEERILELLAAEKTPRIRKPNRRPVLPVWAGALLVTFQAVREGSAAAKTQRRAQ